MFYGTSRLITTFTRARYWTVLSQTNRVDTVMLYISKFHFNFILPCMLRSSKWSLTLRISNQYCVIYRSPIHATFPANLILFDLVTLTVSGSEHKLWSVSCSSFDQRPLLPRFAYSSPHFILVRPQSVFVTVNVRPNPTPMQSSVIYVNLFASSGRENRFWNEY
jgi:hypothetical protein